MKNHNLIGPAGSLANLLGATVPAAHNAKLLFCGEPGIGKSALARWLSTVLCGDEDRWSLEAVNGRNVSIHKVREWTADVQTSSLFGTGWKVKLVDEVDTMPADSQDALLSFLDELPARRAFIATSNMELGKLTARFSTRLQRHTVTAPEAPEIAGLLTGRGLPIAVATQIAVMCGGCVRAALLDADGWMGAAQVKRGAVGKLSFA